MNKLLERLAGDIRRVLGDEALGVYLHGSLALDDFNPARSDIDFVAATRRRLASEKLAELAEMHRAIAAGGNPWAQRLEGSYIPARPLRRHDPADADFPALRCDGSFDVDTHGSDWIIQRWVLRERGVCLFGPPPVTLVDPVSAQDLHQAAAGILREWWQPMLTHHYRLPEREYQAYAVLTMCRSLYTLEINAVASKTAAAQWALTHLASRWHGLIERALAYPHGEQADAFEQTLEFIGYTVTNLE